MQKPTDAKDFARALQRVWIEAAEACQATHYTLVGDVGRGRRVRQLMRGLRDMDQLPGVSASTIDRASLAQLCQELASAYVESWVANVVPRLGFTVSPLRLSDTDGRELPEWAYDHATTRLWSNPQLTNTGQSFETASLDAYFATADAAARAKLPRSVVSAV